MQRSNTILFTMGVFIITFIASFGLSYVLKLSVVKASSADNCIIGQIGPNCTLSGVVNRYYSGISIVGNTITLNSSVGADVVLAPKNKLLLVNMKGDVTKVGNYQEVFINTIASSGSNLVITVSNLGSFTPSSVWQAVYVPQCDNITLAGDITGVPWDGSKGGIVAINANGKLKVDQYNIDASGLGYRAGLRVGGAQGLPGEFGESAINSYGNAAFSDPTGVAGGGSEVGGGAGGGAGAGLNANGGDGMALWDKSGSFGAFTSAIGKGGVAANYSQASLVFGNGGGGTISNYGPWTAGAHLHPNDFQQGHGGGIVWIQASEIEGWGKVNVSGKNGRDGNGSAAGDLGSVHGGTGGGGGGTIYVELLNQNLSGVLMNANGGNGGNVSDYTPAKGGAGGAGGAGKIIGPNSVSNYTYTAGINGIQLDKSCAPGQIYIDDVDKNRNVVASSNCGAFRTVNVLRFAKNGNTVQNSKTFSKCTSSVLPLSCTNPTTSSLTVEKGKTVLVNKGTGINANNAGTVVVTTPTICSYNSATNTLLGLSVGTCSYYINWTGTSTFPPTINCNGANVAVTLPVLSCTPPTTSALNVTVNSTVTVNKGSSTNSNSTGKVVISTPTICSYNATTNTIKGLLPGVCKYNVNWTGLNTSPTSISCSGNDITVEPLVLSCNVLPKVASTTLKKNSTIVVSKGSAYNSTGVGTVFVTTPTTCSYNSATNRIQGLSAGTCNYYVQWLPKINAAPALINCNPVTSLTIVN